jgi:teichuronic acid biosynthesis glycosyltransferase TuaG
MSSEPLVSIITPAYNAERFIEQTIQSVIGQTYTAWEHLIVVDRNSNDKTEDIVRRFAKLDSRIRCITSPEALGAAANRNLALVAALGEYVAFIDADDLWTENKLEKQVQFMQSQQVDFSFTGFKRIDEQHKFEGRFQSAPARVAYADLLQNNTIACLTAMFRLQPFRDIRFQELGWEDMAFWLQILKRVDFAYGLNECLAYYRIVNGSRSNNKLFAAKLRWQTFRLVEKLSRPRSLYLFTHYILTSVAKYLRF